MYPSHKSITRREGSKPLKTNRNHTASSLSVFAHAADESQESATNEETASNDAEAADTDNTDTTEDNTEE